MCVCVGDAGTVVNMYVCMYVFASGMKPIWTEETDRETDKQTDRQTDEQIDKISQH